VDAVLNSKVAVVDATKCKMYIKNFGEFFINQIEHADTIVLSRTDKLSQEKLEKAVELIREYNDYATIITTPWSEITGLDILATIEQENDLLLAMLEEMEHEHHEQECCCDHHHEEEEHECCCGHHHEEDHKHHHHHEHGDGCTCGCGEHHEHGHHHADEVFTSWGLETPVQYTKDEICSILEAFEEEDVYGMILRAKGMVPAVDGTWIYFDYVPGEPDVRHGAPAIIGRLCVIGAGLQIGALSALFGAELR
jgi:G3E family GTPase